MGVAPQRTPFQLKCLPNIGMEIKGIKSFPCAAGCGAANGEVPSSGAILPTYEAAVFCVLRGEGVL